MGATSVWATPTVIYGRAIVTDGDYTAWEADDVATEGTNVWIGNFVFNDAYGLYASATGSRSSVMTFDHTANSLQTFDIVFDNLGNTGDGGNYSYLKIGSDIEIQSNQQNQNGAVIINGVSKAISDCNQKNYNRGGDKWTIHVEINTATKTVTALTLVGTAMNGKSASYTLASPTALSSSATFSTVTIGTNRVKGSPAAALTSIKIAEEAQTVTEADYTINYKFGEDIVKTVNGTLTVGATVNAELPFTEGGQKYYAAGDATTSMDLVDGPNVLNVNLRKANEYAYSIDNSFGTEIASGTYIEGEAAINVYWPKYVKNAGAWYECDETSYGVSITGALTKTVSYTTRANLAYFFECENLNVSHSPAANDVSTAYSGGKMVRHYSSSYWYTDALAGGTYNLSIPYKNNNSSATIINIYLRDGEGNLSDTGLSVEGDKQSSGTLSKEGIVVPNGYSIVLNNTTGYNSNVLMDYVALTVISVPVEVTDAGWATYYTPFALDFTKEDDLTAYTAKLENSMVTLTKVDNVPAETGVVLKAAKDTYHVPVAASSTTDKGDLMGSLTEDIDVNNDVMNFYILGMNGSNEAQFQRAASGSIPAGKAYLVVASAEARVLNVVVDDSETTGVSEKLNVSSEKSSTAVYNMQGQRVAQPTKGLYIVNGKKVIVK